MSTEPRSLMGRNSVDMASTIRGEVHDLLADDRFQAEHVGRCGRFDQSGIINIPRPGLIPIDSFSDS